MNQAFTIYFFRDNRTTRVSTGEGEEEPPEEEEEVKSYVNSNPLGIMASMPRPEYDVLMDRI